MRLAYVSPKGLPKAYRELEYLESTGTQYINTGIALANNNIGTKIICEFKSLPSATSPFGAPVYYGLNIRSGGTVVYWNGGGYPTSDTSNIIDTKYTFTLNYKGDLSYTKDNVVYKSDLPTYGFTSGTVYLFAYSPNVQPLYGKIYSCEFTSGTETIRNFIPAQRKSDSVNGMYDTVTQTFYTNAATSGDDFTAGDIVDENTYKYRALMAPTMEQLPSDYQRVEYLQSTGTQWINTGVVPTSLTKSYIDFMVDSFTSYSTLYGAHSNLTSTPDYSHYNYYPFTSIGASTTSLRSVLGDTSAQYEWTSSTMVGTRHNILFNDNYKMYFDGELVHTFTGFATIPTNPIYMFWASGLPTDTYRANGKMYSCKIWDNNTLVRNFIPARRLSDSVLGMYDLVGKTFYTNAGTGTFTAGDDIEDTYKARLIMAPQYVQLPTEYQQVEYIASSGTQWINTGYIPTSSTSISLDFTKATGFNGDNNLAGVRNRTDSLTRFGLTTSTTTAGGFFYGNAGVHTYTINDTINKWKLTPNGFYIDNELQYGLSSQSLTTGTLKLTLFAFNNNDGLQYQNIKAYNFKIWNNNTLVRNMIPCYRKSDSVIGMYDTVNKVFYENAGTGTFTKGNDVDDRYK